MPAASPYASRSGYRLAANLHAGRAGYQAFRARCQVFRRMRQAGYGNVAFWEKSGIRPEAAARLGLFFCRCARDVVAFFAKDGIEWEKPGCVAMKLSIKVIVALLNCRAANLRADSRIAFRLAQAKSPMTAGHRALVLKKGEGREGGECASRPRGFYSAKELLCRRSPCVI